MQKPIIELGPRIIFYIGHVAVTETVCFAFLISVVIVIFAFLATRKMTRVPKGAQLLGEMLVGLVYNITKDAMGEKRSEKFAPYMGTLLTFFALGSCLGMFGLRPIAADLNCTVPFAVISFVMIHYNAVRAHTAKGYMKHLAEPYAFIFPFNVLSDLMFPVTLGMRIFGNLLAGFIVMTLMYHALGVLTNGIGSAVPFFQIAIPLPFHLFFDLFEPGLQAYIFVMLTMVFTANGSDVEEH